VYHRIETIYIIFKLHYVLKAVNACVENKYAGKNVGKRESCGYFAEGKEV